MVQDENAALKAEVENLRRNTPAAPAVAAAPAPPAADAAELRRLRTSAAAATARAAALQEQLTSTQQVLAQWQDSQKKAMQLARARDADARQFEADIKERDTAFAGCEAKNVALVKIADELIARYRGKSTWSALRDQEALFGISRIEFEKLGQEYRGRVIDASVQLPALPPIPAPPPEPADTTTMNQTETNP
jgi:hypothetical protein